MRAKQKKVFYKLFTIHKKKKLSKKKKKGTKNNQVIVEKKEINISTEKKSRWR